MRNDGSGNPHPLARHWSTIVLMVFVLALGLRLHRIAAQSLWNDEGTSVALAMRDWATIARDAANDIHPPLYYYVLHSWIAAFGNSELAVRALSAMLGTLLVCLTFVFGRTVAGHRVALLAALFAALSPFQVYYSQETRMYILTAFLAAASMYSLLYLLSGWCTENSFRQDGRLVTRSASVRWNAAALVYAVSTVLLLYSHYFAAAVLVVENLAFLWWWLVEAPTVRMGSRWPAWRLLLRWIVLQMAVGLCFLPWLWIAQGQLRVWPAISEPLSPQFILLDLLRVFSLGPSVQPRPSAVLLGFALLLVTGVISGFLRRTGRTADAKGRGTWPHLATLLYLLVPIVILYAVSLRRPMYNPKFLLLCCTPFCIFLAQGVAWTTRTITSFSSSARVRHWLRFVITLTAAAFVVVSSLCSLRAYYWDARYARDDYRGIARYIQSVETNGDAILISAPGQVETFAYYYHGDLPLYPLPRQRPLDEGQTESDLREMVRDRKRIFAILWATDESDPGRFVEGWLDGNTYKAMDSWYGNVRFVIYAVPVQPTGAGIEHPLDVRLGEQVQLLGYSLPTTEVRPGDILQLTLFWRAVSPMGERYKVFTHVLDGRGHLVGQRDAEPGGGAKITAIWKEGEQIVDNYGLPILPATPPGDYLIEIGMYGLTDGRRLPVSGEGQAAGDYIVLQSLRVLPALAPPPLSVLGMKGQVQARFGDVTLLGYDLAKLGYEHEPAAPIHPGDILHLTLFWQGDQQPAEELDVVLRVQDSRGKIVLEQREGPTGGLYPMFLWRTGEIVRDQRNVFLPADLTPGQYRVLLAIYRLPDNEPLGASLPLTGLAIQ
jgi:mannosyltransferase